MTHENFKNLSLSNKIEEVMNQNKKTLLTRGEISDNIYLVDSKDTLHTVPIEDKRFLKDPEYKEIFRDVLKVIINELGMKNVDIVNLFYIKESFFNTSYSNLKSINLDTTFNSSNANECLLIYSEDRINMKLEVYDLITGYDNGNKYAVLSSKPIKELDYCKIDPEDNLRGILTNIIR